MTNAKGVKVAEQPVLRRWRRLTWYLADSRVRRADKAGRWHRYSPLWSVDGRWVLVLERRPDLAGWTVVPAWLAPVWLLLQTWLVVDYRVVVPALSFLCYHGFLNVPACRRLRLRDCVRHLWFLPAGRAEGPWWEGTTFHIFPRPGRPLGRSEDRPWHDV